MQGNERPSYQSSLRAIGRYFDRNVYRQVVVAEVEDGYIARACLGRKGNLPPEGIALPMSDVATLIGSQEKAGAVPDDVKAPALCPGGYEDFFRTLGYDLDLAEAGNVCLIELSNGILVSYSSYDPQGAIVRALTFYDPHRIDEFVTSAYDRRSRADSPA